MTEIGTTRRATDVRHESEARLQALLSSLDDLVFELDHEGTYLGIWTADDALLAAPRDEMLGRSLRENVGDDIGVQLTRIVGQVLETGRSETCEYCLKVPAGTRWFQGRLAPISAAPSTPGRVCLLVRDITGQKLAEAARDKAEAQLRYLALYDGLTGLPNRVLFHSRVEDAIEVARRQDRQLSVLMVDVDRFKEINDTLGHSVGDEVLRAVAGRLSKLTRGEDSVARLGADEFSILLPNASQAEAGMVASRVSSCLEEPVVVDDLPLNIDLSIGLAVFPRDGADAGLLLRRADSAMYLAKKARALVSRPTTTRPTP